MQAARGPRVRLPGDTPRAKGTRRILGSKFPTHTAATVKNKKTSIKPLTEGKSVPSTNTAGESIGEKHQLEIHKSHSMETYRTYLSEIRKKHTFETYNRDPFGLLSADGQMLLAQPPTAAHSSNIPLYEKLTNDELKKLSKKVASKPREENHNNLRQCPPHFLTVTPEAWLVPASVRYRPWPLTSPISCWTNQRMQQLLASWPPSFCVCEDVFSVFKYIPHYSYIPDKSS